ncbi:MAG TPA: NADPH-dependent FMN reductase [Verrucomicrobiae bacterium]|jgi:chromate reductase, NAD(P)H dehydrogenase (quinone)|nr:NADPH-dependent FMN reductase [Verrucomicrobiae bacterium]
MTTPIRVLGIPGSLRKKSFNRGLLRAATEMLPEGMSLDVYDLEALPLYNGDVEAAGLPEPVQDFQRRIEAADALLFATPEYNYSVAGVLKNAIDWASRPTPARQVQPFSGKPVAIMGASAGALGTSRAQYHLRQTCVFLNMFPLNRPEVFVPAAQTKFDASGRLTDEPARARIRELLEALLAWTRRLQAK